MPLTAAQLVYQACQDAGTPGYTQQAQNKLQLILDDVCLKWDFGLARGRYDFNLTPGLVNTINGRQNYSGPYPLPLDYLRTSGSSGSEGVQRAITYVDQTNTTFVITPIDLGLGDALIQQPNINGYPTRYWTDVSPETTAQDRIASTTTCSTTTGSHTVYPFSLNQMQVGQSVSGYGIAAGSTITAMSASGAPGTQNITLSLPATATFTGALSSGTAGVGSSSIMAGTPVNLFVYPPPIYTFPTTVRYQKLMPALTDFSRVPWFPDERYLLKELTAMMCETARDPRQERFAAQAAQMIGKYAEFADDKTSRAQTVILDAQRFRAGGRRRVREAKSTWTPFS